mgnify:CR=1 FL=1
MLHPPPAGTCSARHPAGSPCAGKGRWPPCLHPARPARAGRAPQVARKIQQLCANAAAAGGLCDKQVADLPRFMADTHHAVRRIRSGVQVECPARPCRSSSRCWRMTSGVYSARPASVHTSRRRCGARQTVCGGIQLGIRLDQLGTLGALPARDLGDRVGGAPLVIQVRAALAGAFPALAAAPGVNFIVVAGQQHRRDGLALPHFRAGELGVFQQAVPVAFVLIAFSSARTPGCRRSTLSATTRLASSPPVST